MPKAGHQQARTVGGEARAADGSVAAADSGGGMQVAAISPACWPGPRFVAEGQAAIVHLIDGATGQSRPYHPDRGCR